MEQIAIIEEIHRQFEAQPDTKTLGAMAPQGFDVDEFAALVDRYRLYYPQHNFLTEKQVAEICRKYELLMGPDILFSDHIPKRAEKAMQSFRLLDSDAELKRPESLFDFVVNSDCAASIFCPSAVDEEAQIGMEVSFIATSSSMSVVPVGKRLVLIYKPEMFSFDLLERQMHGDSELLVFIKTIKQHSFNELIISQSSGVSFRGFLHNTISVSLSVSYSDFAKNETANLNSSVCRHIVAPAKMFQKHADAVVVDDGYRLVFKHPEMLPTRMFGGIDDPIVLQPVRGGYLVVTKWGAEAQIPDVSNAAEN